MEKGLARMARTKEFDVDQALEAAMRLFWEKGYEAASLSDLTNAMGIQRPSLYSTFGDKLGLFEAALRRYSHFHASDLRTRLQRSPSVKEGFRRLFEEVVEDGYSVRPDRGCFCINAMVEMAPRDEKFELLTREHQMYLSILFAETLERGIRSGELSADLAAKPLARTLVVALIGVTVMLKARPERSFVQQSVDAVLSLVK